MLHFDLVVQQRAVAAANRLNASHLKALPLQALDRVTQQPMSFFFQFSTGFATELDIAKDSAIEAVGFGVRIRILSDKQDSRGANEIVLRPIVEPAARRDQNEHHDEHNHNIVRPAAAFIRPKNRPPNRPKEFAHISWQKRRQQQCHRAYATRGCRMPRLPGCA
jgi:hypothetical protein